ncbi:MAG: RNA pseudouridine synthase [Clostridia bacterium]|nr:MAG: RNA pseudouridine synthase [Clostridia bacterium]
MPQRFIVKEIHRRLDRFLANQLPEHSRAEVQRWIKAGLAIVNGAPGKANTAIKSGDVILLTIPEPTPTRLQPEAIPLVILYEDDDIIAVDKPAGMVVHPAAGHHSGTLVNAILHHFPDLEGVGEGGRPGIVHRLDKDTSGVILVAKNSRAHRYLQAQFKERTIQKMYLALAHGHLKHEQGIINAPIGRHPRHRQLMAVLSTGKGREARTKYAVVAYYDANTLVAVHPLTGRTHQIRVHLASLGHPIVGDTVYGRRDIYKMGRHFLHARRIRFRRPADDASIELESSLPSELQALLDKLS